MIVLLDIGNSQVKGCLADGDTLENHFRFDVRANATCHDFGSFLTQFLDSNDINRDQISQIAISCVAPEVMSAIHIACTDYLNAEPFVLSIAAAKGITIGYQYPERLGADRLANIIATTALYPQQNSIVVDIGTGITIDVVRSDATFLGGIILPGPRIAMESLFQNTALLPKVDIVRPERSIGTNTIECIQSGLYFGTLGAIKGCIAKLTKEAFGESSDVLTIGTGGFSRLFIEEDVFDKVDDHLVMRGLLYAHRGTTNPAT